MAVHQVTKVNLPEKARARLEVEGNQQRAQKAHDIRGAIPLVDYTNPAKFPPYIFREYPKMPLLSGNAPIVIDESGGVLVFYDAADEAEFNDMNPEIADEIKRNTPAKALADTLAAKDAELEDLRARLRNAGIQDRDKKPKNTLANVVKTAASTEAESKGTADPQPNDHAGLRSNLPPNRPKPNPFKKN